MLPKCKSTIAQAGVQLATKHHTRRGHRRKKKLGLSPSSYSSSPEKKAIQVHRQGCAVPGPHVLAHHRRSWGVTRVGARQGCTVPGRRAGAVTQGCSRASCRCLCHDLWAVWHLGRPASMMRESIRDETGYQGRHR
jgi:hypothetical protein